MTSGPVINARNNFPNDELEVLSPHEQNENKFNEWYKCGSSINLLHINNNVDNDCKPLLQFHEQYTEMTSFQKNIKTR